MQEPAVHIARIENCRSLHRNTKHLPRLGIAFKLHSHSAHHVIASYYYILLLIKCHKSYKFIVPNTSAASTSSPHDLLIARSHTVQSSWPGTNAPLRNPNIHSSSLCPYHVQNTALNTANLSQNERKELSLKWKSWPAIGGIDGGGGKREYE